VARAGTREKDQAAGRTCASQTAAPYEMAAVAAPRTASAIQWFPVICQGTVVATLEVYRKSELPWSRFEIRRARMIAHQLGAAVERVGRRESPQAA